MDNPEKLATFGTKDTGRRQTSNLKSKTQKTKAMSNNGLHQNPGLNPGASKRPHQIPGLNPGASEGQTVTASYKTPAMFLI